MATARQKAISAARKANRRLTGLEVVLVRRVADPPAEYRSSETDPVKATIAQTDIEEVYEAGGTLTIRYIDFLIDATDYRFEGLSGGLPVDPIEGDEIEVTLEDGPAKFKAVPNGERVFRRSDRYGYVYRVHSKEVRAA